MSWLSDRFNDAVYGWGTAWKNISSVGGHFENDVSKFFENEVVNKSQLRGSQLEGVLSGVPVVGDILKGIEGANQMEDLYNNAGKVANYPAVQSLGTSSLGHALPDISRKIESGTHDLYEHYTGTKDDTEMRTNNQRMWEYMAGPNNAWNKRRVY